MNKGALLLPLFVVALFGDLFAQNNGDGTSLQPSAPFLAVLPDHAAWTIIFSPKPPAATTLNKSSAQASLTRVPVLSSAQPNPDAPLEDSMAKMAVTKAGLLKKEHITWLNAQQTEDWLDGKVFFHQDPLTKRYGFRTARDDPYGANGGKDFPDLGWVKASRFLRIEQKGGESCFLYRCEETQKTSKREAGLPYRPTSVWISLKTKLPVAMEDDVKTGAYQFSTPTETSLTLPAECRNFLQIIDDYERKLESQRMVPPH